MVAFAAAWPVIMELLKMLGAGAAMTAGGYGASKLFGGEGEGETPPPQSREEARYLAAMSDVAASAEMGKPKISEGEQAAWALLLNKLQAPPVAMGHRMSSDDLAGLGMTEEGGGGRDRRKYANDLAFALSKQGGKFVTGDELLGIADQTPDVAPMHAALTMFPEYYS